MLTSYRALTKTHSNTEVFDIHGYSEFYTLLEFTCAMSFARCAHRAWKRLNRSGSEPAPRTLLEYVVLGLPYRMKELDLRGLRC